MGHVLLEESAMRFNKIKTVFVNEYPRFRFGRWEHVCQHWRSHPGQMSFPF